MVIFWIVNINCLAITKEFFLCTFIVSSKFGIVCVLFNIHTSELHSQCKLSIGL